jgi:signal transduction histidine kinase
MLLEEPPEMLLHVQSLEQSVRNDSAPKLRERLAKASAAGLRLDALIHQLLDVSRITGGRLTLDPEPLRLDRLTREAIERLQEQAARAQCRLDVEIEDGVDAVLDRLRTEQVITNLVSNAMKYGRGKPIEVTLRRVRDQAVLRVTDHGIGIERKEQRQIFERFERAIATREYGGFGLGLWIARQVVEATGGNIMVESTPGRGATFTVRLPLDAREKMHAAQ